MQRDGLPRRKFAMPISAEQWRASVGAANASRRPSQPKRSLPCWEVFLVIVAALLLVTLLPEDGETGSRKGVSRRRGGGGELAPSLLIAPRRRFVLIIAGDIETNPGPFTKHGYLHGKDLDVLVEELSPVKSQWETLGSELGVSQGHLENIRTRYSQHGDCLRKTLREWLSHGRLTHPGVMWGRVVAALRSIGEDRLCSELKVKYGLLEKSDLDVVANELDAVSTKWYTLGQNIRLWPNVLDPIRMQYSDNHDCLREMVSYQLEHYTNTTWSEIIAGLRSSGDSQLADHLETKYCSSLLHESELDMIVNELSTISAKWEKLEKQLGMDEFLSYTRPEYPDSAGCLREMISQWLQLNSHVNRRLLTWSHIVHALKSPNVGESQLADYLKEKYLPAAASGAQKILEEALEKGYVDCHIWKVIVTGAAGSGKTSLKHRLFGEEPPSIRCSTALAEAAIRAISRVIVGTDLTGWFRVTYDQLMEMLGGALKAGIPMEKTKASHSDPPQAVVHEQSPKIDASKPTRPSEMHGNRGTSSRASPKSTTASAHTPEAPTATKVSSSKQELVRLVERSKGSKRFFELQWIHFIDSGGQPQFHEVLPAFIRNTTATVFVMKLSERLDEHPTIEYYDGNGQLCGKPSRYALRNDQMLQHCIRTVLSQPSTREGKHSKVLLVGTHRDLEGSSSESRAKKLIDMLKSTFQDHLVYYRPFSEVVFPVNAKNPVEHDNKVFAMIRKQIEDKKHAPPPFKVPIGWFLLEQDITKSAKGGVISRKECLAIAAILNINEEALKAALKHFDDLNIFLYYPSVLPEVVFCQPQVLPDKVTEFVHFSYCLHSDSPPVALEGKWLQFRDKGIVTVDMFQDKRFSAHYIPDLFTPADLINLYEHLLIVAPLSTTEYLMPSLLQMIAPEEVKEQLPRPSTSAAPLLVHFPAGCAQNGVFCCLVVHLLSKCHWKIACGPKGTPLCISRSCIHFQLPDTPVCVTLVDSFAFLEVHVQAPPTEYNSVCPTIRKAIFSGLKAAADVLRYNNSTPVPAFLCKCSSPPHTAIPDGKCCYLMCTKCTEYVPLTQQHSVWLDHLHQLVAEATPPRQPVYSPLISDCSQLPTSASLRKETDCDVAPPAKRQRRHTAAEGTGPAAALIPQREAVCPSPSPLTLQAPVEDTISYLRGVDVIGETKLLVTSDGQTFHWVGYGLKLHIPQGALPAQLEKCTLHIKVALSGQFKFLQSTSLVSAIYWLDTEPRCKFSQPLTVEIQHCVNPSQCSELYFVRAKCSQETLPYTFKPVGGGVFSYHSSFGSIPLSHFSLVGVTGSDQQCSQYCAGLYYLGNKNTFWKIHLVVTKNLEACITAVYSVLSDAAVGPDVQFEFESDCILLDIPADGTVKEGWSIVPLTPLVVNKWQVDNYRGGQRVPRCQLRLQWTGGEQPAVLCHKVTLIGAKEPFNFLTIESDPVAQGNDPETLTAHPKTCHITPDQRPNLLELLNFPGKSGNINIPQRISTKYFMFGVLLLNDKTGAEVSAITTKYRDDAEQINLEILRLWVGGKGKLLSWDILTDVLKAIGLNSLAGDIQDSLLH